MEPMENLYCYGCRNTSRVVVAHVPRSAEGEFICPICRSELVEFIEDSNPPPQQLASSSNSVLPQPFAAMVPLMVPPTAMAPLFVGPRPHFSTTVIVQNGHEAPRVIYQSAGGGGGGGGVDVTGGGAQPPSLADLLRQEIQLVQNAAAGGHGGFFGVGGDDANMRQLMHRILMQHEPHAQPTPADVIDRLPVLTGGLPHSQETNSSGEDVSCSICYESMCASSSSGSTDASPLEHNNMKLMQLPCGHWFHEDCIRPWLSMSTTCPSCRRCVLPQ